LLSLLDMCEDFEALWTQLIDEGGNVTDEGAPRRYSDRTTLLHAPAEDSDDEVEEEPEIQAAPSVQDVDTLTEEYERQLHFLIAGLRGVSRVGGEPAWISLAERLQLGVDYVGNG